MWEVKYYDIKTKTDQYTRPTKPIFIIMYPSTDTQFVLSYIINISTESTIIPTSPSQFVSKDYFENTIQESFARYYEISKKSDQIFEKQQE